MCFLREVLLLCMRWNFIAFLVRLLVKKNSKSFPRANCMIQLISLQLNDKKVKLKYSVYILNSIL